MSDLKALIVEDVTSIAAIYEEALQLAGYETETVDNGRTAIERLTETIPSLILLDLHLPGVPGEEVLKYIQGDPKLADAVVFIATADHMLAEQLRSEVDLVLLKPISFMQLRDIALRFQP